MEKQTIYLVITIDTECDKDSDWNIQYPLRFTSVTEGIPRVLTPLFEAFQIKPTYLLSPEVICDNASVKTLQTVPNCELGTHLHGEFVEPQGDFSPTRTHTPQLLYAPEVERAKLENLTQMFADRFGYRPTSFRAGRFGLSEFTLTFLSELGYLVDSSVTPFWTHNFEGRTKRNYWGAPLQPYCPSRRDMRRSGKLRLLEVPVTIVNAMLMHWPRWILRRMSSSTRWYKRVLVRLGRPVPQTIWLRPQRSTPEQLIVAADRVIAWCINNNKPVVLNMMYHSVEIIPGASPYAQSDDDVQYIIRSQEALFTHLHRTYDVKPVGLSEVRKHVHVMGAL